MAKIRKNYGSFRVSQTVYTVPQGQPKGPAIELETGEERDLASLKESCGKTWQAARVKRLASPAYSSS
jgi:hypothetical protein